MLFSVYGKGYVVTGGEGSAGTTVWEYNPTSDLWSQKTSLEASGRIEAVGFSIQDVGYITTGRTGSVYFDDIWGFDPVATQVDYNDELILAGNDVWKNIMVAAIEN